MNAKSFISPFTHETFSYLINTLLTNDSIDKEDPLMVELIKERDELEKIFTRYKMTFSELGHLINRYRFQQTQVRKKIRQVQLKSHSKNKIK